MSLKFINQQEGNTKVEHFQAEVTEQKINEVSIVGSNPLIITDTVSTKWNSDFDMLTESLW
jgi:hypothetical protein